AQAIQICMSTLAQDNLSTAPVPWVNPLAPRDPPSSHAVTAAGIHPADTLDTRILKSLILIHTEEYFEKNALDRHPPQKDADLWPLLLKHSYFRASYGHEENWDKLRSGDEVLEQKLGGGPWSYTHALLGILRHAGFKPDQLKIEQDPAGAPLLK